MGARESEPEVDNFGDEIEPGGAPLASDSWPEEDETGGEACIPVVLSCASFDERHPGERGKLEDPSFGMASPDVEGGLGGSSELVNLSFGASGPI